MARKKEEKEPETLENEHRLVCVKRKVSKKYYPPDVSALKLLVELEKENSGDEIMELVKKIQSMTIRELEEFKRDLIEN